MFVTDSLIYIYWIKKQKQNTKNEHEKKKCRKLALDPKK